MKSRENEQKLSLQDLREIAKELHLEDEFDDIEAEVCYNCCLVLGGGGHTC